MIDQPPTVLVAAAQAVLSTLDEARIPACLIGGMVIARWGQPRATTDADFSVLARYGEEVRRRGGRLDVDRIRRWGREFAELKEDPDLLRPFEEALVRAGIT
jgi:hypothetical protein